MTPITDPRAFALAVASLFGIALARGQATYWIARAVARGAGSVGEHSPAWRRRVAAWLGGRRAATGRALLGRWGLPLVTLCYLTLGLQTIVLAAAGFLRVGWPRFTLAQLPGALAWALIYSTIGFAAFEAAVAAAAGSPVGVAVLLAIVALLALVIVRQLRRRRARL